MSAINDSGYKTFTSTAAALAKAVLVKYDNTGKILVNGGTNNSAIGTTLEDALASATNIPVKLVTAPGTHFVTASVNNVAKNDLLYPAANGQVTNVAGMLTAIGLALEASTGVGDIIEAILFSH